MYRTGWLVFMDPVGHSHMIGSETGFIAQRPVDDRRMVFIWLNISGITIQERFAPGCILRKTAPVLMRLEIGLGTKIDPIFITQLVPQWCVGIMAGAYRVDVILLHQFDILNHRFAGNIPSGYRIM